MISMRRAAAIVVVLAIALPTRGGEPDETTKTLSQLELDWANAVERNDVKGIGRFLHEDFTFTSPTGQIIDRQNHLNDFRDGNARFPLVALSEVVVRTYGSIAVVTSRPTINGKVKVNGQFITLTFQAARWTDTLILCEGSWTCVARQQSNVPPAGTNVEVVLAQVLQETWNGKEAKLTVVRLAYGPGESSAAHQHPGPAVVYVLDGAIESQVEAGPLTTCRQGDTFFEPAHSKHLVSRNASQTEPAHFLVYFLAAKDEPQLTIPLAGSPHR